MTDPEIMLPPVIIRRTVVTNSYMSFGLGERPENALTGTMFQVDSWQSDDIEIPYPMTRLRFWRNTPNAFFVGRIDGSTGLVWRLAAMA